MAGLRSSASAEIAAAVRGLFDLPVGVGVTIPGRAYPPLMAGEAAPLTRALPARVAEFTAGRHAARLAMQNIGLAPQRVLTAPDRAPIWPAGMVGSISHCARWCVAVVAQEADCRALGIDIEDDSPLPDALAAEVCSAAESEKQAASPHGAKGIFCAKEAAYKAQYPLTQTLFGFDRLAVHMQDDGRFDARFTQATSGFSEGDNLPGRIVSVAGHLVTGVAIGQIERKGA